MIDKDSAHRELLLKGVVPLTDPTRLAGGLDLEAPPKRPDLLLRIEHACRIREDEGVFSIIAA